MDKKSMVMGFLLGVLVVVGIWITFGKGSDHLTQPAPQNEGGSIRIRISSIFVDNQEKALKFYTEKLGFIKKEDIPIGKYRWLTVVSPEDPDGTELLLEPNAHAAVSVFQKAIYKDNIPATALIVQDIQKEYQRLINLGVEFSIKPTKAGEVTIAVLDDTCGNLIQIVQE